MPCHQSLNALDFNWFMRANLTKMRSTISLQLRVSRSVNRMEFLVLQQAKDERWRWQVSQDPGHWVELPKPVNFYAMCLSHHCHIARLRKYFKGGVDIHCPNCQTFHQQIRRSARQRTSAWAGLPVLQHDLRSKSFLGSIPGTEYLAAPKWAVQ